MDMDFRIKRLLQNSYVHMRRFKSILTKGFYVFFGLDILMIMVDEF